MSVKEYGHGKRNGWERKRLGAKEGEMQGDPA